MSYTVVADICEGIHDCIAVCPEECMISTHETNAKSTRFTFIEPDRCTDCGACLSVCPIEGAILDNWQPALQVPATRVAKLTELHARFGGDEILLQRLLTRGPLLEGDSADVVLELRGETRVREARTDGTEVWYWERDVRFDDDSGIPTHRRWRLGAVMGDGRLLRIERPPWEPIPRKGAV